MKKTIAAAFLVGFASVATAQHVSDLNPDARHLHVKGWAKPGGGGAQNLSYHGGPVIRSAKVVAIFWGPSWTAGDAPLASAIQNFIASFGTSPQYKTITQYSDGAGAIMLSNLGTTAWFDSTVPPTNVTDAIVQTEVNKYLGNSAGDTSTIYEVFLPASSYSSDGTATSCGGPNLSYCAYHSHFIRNGLSIKYSIQPYPSCGGCQNSAAGWSVAQNAQMFIGHETREAVTDAEGSAWFDRRGYEADDKCAWTNLFLDANGYGYQPEWSNARSGCVASTP